LINQDRTELKIRDLRLSDFAELKIILPLDQYPHRSQHLVEAKSLSHHQYLAHHYKYSNWIDSNYFALYFE
jgi:hypothetical protein